MPLVRSALLYPLPKIHTSCHNFGISSWGASAGAFWLMKRGRNQHSWIMLMVILGCWHVAGWHSDLIWSMCGRCVYVRYTHSVYERRTWIVRPAARPRRSPNGLCLFAASDLVVLIHGCWSTGVDPDSFPWDTIWDEESQSKSIG